LNKEQRNKEKRKNTPLTVDEWFGFFFVPINSSARLFPTKDFNDSEEDRFEKFGFEKKMKQSLVARFLGIIFYIIAISLLMKYLK